MGYLILLGLIVVSVLAVLVFNFLVLKRLIKSKEILILTNFVILTLLFAAEFIFLNMQVRRSVRGRLNYIGARYSPTTNKRFVAPRMSENYRSREADKEIRLFQLEKLRSENKISEETYNKAKSNIENE